MQIDAALCHIAFGETFRLRLKAIDACNLNGRVSIERELSRHKRVHFVGEQRISVICSAFQSEHNKKAVPKSQTLADIAAVLCQRNSP